MMFGGKQVVVCGYGEVSSRPVPAFSALTGGGQGGPPIRALTCLLDTASHLAEVLCADSWVKTHRRVELSGVTTWSCG